MSQFTLNYWSKGQGLISHQQTGTIVDRVYINDESGGSLGYWERREAIVPRGSASYYDRHRHAKGDAVVAEGPTVRFVSDQLEESAVLAAAGITPEVVEQANRDCGGGVFVAVARKARNGLPTWYGNTPANEVKRLKKQQSQSVFFL